MMYILYSGFWTLPLCFSAETVPSLLLAACPVGACVPLTTSMCVCVCVEHFVPFWHFPDLGLMLCIHWPSLRVGNLSRDTWFLFLKKHSIGNQDLVARSVLCYWDVISSRWSQKIEKRSGLIHTSINIYSHIYIYTHIFLYLISVYRLG